MQNFIAGFLLITSLGQGTLRLNLDKIMHIESSGNEMAFNENTHARGIFQITPIVLEEYNKMVVRSPEKRHTLEELFDPKINLKIAKWYLGKRIPQMLKYYKKPVDHKNVIIAWNAGIRYVLDKDIPKETINFIEKYEDTKS